MWIDYKLYNLKSNPKTTGVYKIVRKSDGKVMSVGCSVNLYDRFHLYNLILTGTKIPHGIKGKMILEHSDEYTIEIIERDIPKEDLSWRESHWQRAYKTNYREGGWDIAGANWSKLERDKRNYNPEQDKIARQKRFKEHPEKHQADLQYKKEWHQRNKEERKAARRMQTIFKKQPLSARKFYRVNFGSWINALIAYDIYEATVRN